MKRPTTMLLAAVALTASGMDYGAKAEERRAVQYGELDLTKPAGQEVFMSRLHAAATSVCGKGSVGLNSRQRDLDDACVQDAIDRAIASLPVHLAAGLDGYRIREAELR